MTEPSLADSYQRALALFRQGQLAAAETACRAIVAEAPQHFEALRLLAEVLSRQQRIEEALPFLRQAATLRPGDIAAQGSLAVALSRLGQLDEAISRLTQLAELGPRSYHVHYNLGLTLAQAGRLQEAAPALERACQFDPSQGPIFACLGAVYRDLGKTEQAIRTLREAVRLTPDDSAAWYSLGKTYLQAADFAGAIEPLREAVRLRPAAAETRIDLGIALLRSRQPEAAMTEFGEAVRLAPGLALAHHNLANLLIETGGSVDEAEAAYRESLRLDPDFFSGHLNLGSLLADKGEVEAATAEYQQALRIRPDPSVASNVLLMMHYLPGVTSQGLLAAHRQYDRQYAQPLRPKNAPPSARGRRERLRIGFLSPDLACHPVGFFLIPLLEHLPHDLAEATCYSDRSRKDAITRRLAAASRWRDVKPLEDERLYELIREDQIDILFDLAGHTAHNRLPLFVRRPAPMQITWAGYVGTTGMAEMDYLLADRHHTPPGVEPLYTERILRMPHGYICYEPPAYAPPVGPLPAASNGFVTFGSFNNPRKMSGSTLCAWAKILQRLPDSRLVLKYHRFDSASVARRIREAFADQGIDDSRLDLQGKSPHDALFAQYNRIDIALDPMPYCGGLTTCEAAWMGVPVVTCPGETFASRHSLSHLSTVGVTELVADDEHDYVERAVALAGDLPRLALLRASLRERMAASKLCDAETFAADFVQRLREAWESDS
ncbi:MAG TPA: tetratricopeptide repeat protein [Pirellulales bacterium]|nr:tetratricopeptide repeat protein [Pirellulales bacterium]